MDIEVGTISVAGTYFCELNESEIKSVDRYDPVRFVREIDNKYDPNAIRIEHESVGKIGYVPKEGNETLAKFMDEGVSVLAKVTEIKPKSSRPFTVSVTFVESE